MGIIKGILKQLGLYICVFLLVAMLISGTIGIIARYVFNNSLMWTEEFCRYALIWVSFLAAPYAVMAGGHLFVDVLTTIILKNHPGAKKVFLVIDSIIWAGFSLFLTWWGAVTVSRVVEMSTVLGISLKWVYLAIPLGCALMAVRVISKMITDVFIKKVDQPGTAEAGGVE